MVDCFSYTNFIVLRYAMNDVVDIKYMFIKKFQQSTNKGKYLIEHGTDIYKDNEYDESLSYKCCGNENILNLVEHKVYINNKRNSDTLLLNKYCGNENSVKYLVDIEFINIKRNGDTSLLNKCC
ncbi:hypothetical protein BCR32DRAFT_278876 [Anaeromyces robustus]|uniref:Uncharacterized protein n=1 Tax=Anaeromyces robustus TaxID=1754192 RepID=A0A1Y1X9L1_9FUNG|nr:hypothetical protein BCR32DRAFT_278876 [Anaeromyces robustus]|eukprot:ORX82409.1 hypothetical protein BCR32DRAFT_278876 [Anaeromyces robustus]